MVIPLLRPVALTLVTALLISSQVSANSPPTIEQLAEARILVGDQLRQRVIPRDEDGDVPGLRMENFPPGAMFSDNGDGTRTFVWTPGIEDVGTRELRFVAFDARDVNLSTTEAFRVVVLPAEGRSGNLAPELESLTDRSIVLGESFDFRVVPIDPEGVVPGVRLDRLPVGASFNDNRDGTRQFRWTPEGGAQSETLTFTAFDSDDPSLKTSRTITLRVDDTRADLSPGRDLDEDRSEADSGGVDTDNIRPVFVGLDDVTVALGQQFEFRVVPTDEDGDVPGLSVDRLPPGAAFDDNRDGTRTFRWRPFPINLGDTYVSFQAIDARDPSLRTSKTIRLTTFRDPDNPVNFEPTINGIQNPIIRVGDTLNQRVKPVDPDFTIPELVVLNPPDGADFVDNGDGTRTLRWLADSGDLGRTDVSFRATDAEDGSVFFERTISIDVVTPESLRRPGRRLRELASDRGFLIGYAAVLEASSLPDNELYRDIAAEEFNIVTPENSHKMSWVQPFEGQFEWEDADELADYAESHGMALHGHPLVWYRQLPDWVQRLDPADAERVMLEHIAALAGRYRGRVLVWDVVNEALEADGSFRDSIWHQGMGEDYIRDAFLAAKEADPSAALIYNDFDVAWINDKSDSMYSLMQRELARGTPIDGVGFQMHLRSGFTDYDSVIENLQRFADLGLDIYITEFDVALDAPDTLDTQADVFRRSLQICLDQPRCKAMQTWGYTDRYSWRSGFTPLLLTNAYLPKPSYRAWQEALEAE